MYSITCDRCGEADVVDLPEAQVIVFAEQRARLCGRCHAALAAFLASADAPTFEAPTFGRPLETTASS